MSGRGCGHGRGRGTINMTPSELAALINQHVADALGNHNPQPAPIGQGVCTYKSFMDCKPNLFTGVEGAVGLLRWFEKLESVFEMCNCPVANHVKYATGALDGAALTWWNTQVQMLGVEIANQTTWDDFKNLMKVEYCSRDEVQKLEMEFWNLKMTGSEIEAYTIRSHELATLCLNMINPSQLRIERYLNGLVPEIQSMVTAARPNTIQDTIRLAYKLTDQAVAQVKLPPRGAASNTSDGGNKRKWKSSSNNKKQSSSSSTPTHQLQSKRFDNSRNFNQSSSSSQHNGGYSGTLHKCNKCNYHHNGPCNKNNCERCDKFGHAAKNCRVKISDKPPQAQEQSKGCYECGQTGHFKRNCPKLKKNGNGGNSGGNGADNRKDNGGNNNGGAKGRAFVIGTGEARNDPSTVTGKFTINGCFASVLFDSSADRSFISLKFSKLLDVTSTALDSNYTIEIANGKIIKASYMFNVCKIGLFGYKFDIDLLSVTLGSFDVVVGMDWLSKNQAEIICRKKLIRLPLRSGEILTVEGDKSGAVVGIISNSGNIYRHFQL